MKKAAILLTNYLRPKSLETQLTTFRAVRDVFEIYVIDNSIRDVNLRQHVTIEDWYTYIEHGINLGAGYRFLMSGSLPHDFLIAIDDDIFLTVDQLFLLYNALRADPDRVHGVWGQTLDFQLKGHPLKGGIHKETKAVHVISRVYAYTPEISFRSMCIARDVGFTAWRHIGPTDDILLSAASFEPPLCHAVDELRVCETADTEGIATWRRDGFFAARDAVIEKLLKFGFFHGSR
jgi:hypothetical protein